MTCWEYHWVRVPLYGSGEAVGQYDIDSLDDLGAKGWEAYAHSEHGSNMVVHLKRPLRERGEDSTAKR